MIQASSFFSVNLHPKKKSLTYLFNRLETNVKSCIHPQILEFCPPFGLSCGSIPVLYFFILSTTYIIFFKCKGSLIDTIIDSLIFQTKAFCTLLCFFYFLKLWVLKGISQDQTTNFLRALSWSMYLLSLGPPRAFSCILLFFNFTRLKDAF